MLAAAPIALAFQLTKARVEPHALRSRIRLAHSRFDIPDFFSQLTTTVVAIPAPECFTGREGDSEYESHRYEAFHGIVIADPKPPDQR